MSKVVSIKGGAYGPAEAFSTATQKGVKKGFVVGYDDQGRLFYTSFGDCSVESTFFMMEAAKHDIMREAYEE